MSVLFVIDIDGTIADAGRRFAEAGPEPSRDNKLVYDAWVRAVQSPESLSSDKPVPGMLALCRALGYYPFDHVVYLTSREERWRLVTEEWLTTHKFPRLALIMRGNGNYLEGGEFKESTIDTLMQTKNASDIVVIDDDGRGDIEDMCKRRGWTFLKARSGGQK